MIHLKIKSILIRALLLGFGSSFATSAPAWLGDRGSVEIEYPETAVDDIQIDQDDPLWQEWTPSETLLEKRQEFRQKKEKSWPGSKPSVRSDGFTYYPENLSTSISVQFSTNEIEVIVPRQPNMRTHYGYDQYAERKNVQHFLVELLKMKRSELLKQLATELLIDPDTLADVLKNDPYVLNALFKNQVPSDAVIEQLAFQILKTAKIQVQEQVSGKVSVTPNNKVAYIMDMPEHRIKFAAIEYHPLVEQFSYEFEVPESLLLAVIHTESHFNPVAQSGAQAYGLMQVVPDTAGKDVAKMIYDVPPEISPSFLLDAENNIRFGAAYLNILYYKYLRSIDDERSRAYVTIAAYNAGPKNTARAFVDSSNLSEAIEVINSLPAKAVLDQLLNYAPTQETRQYLAKVLAREEYYQSVLKYW